jgi:hypothetical protein
VDELGNAISLGIILMHVGPEANHVNGMEAPTVGIKERHDVPCGDLGVKGFGGLDVIIPYFLDGFMEEFGHALPGCLVAVEVI